MSRLETIHSTSVSDSENSLPNLTPVHLTFTLALELFPAAAHSSSTFRAHPIQNAGDHIGSRFDRTQSDKPHTSPHPSHRMIRHRESRSGGEAPQDSFTFLILQNVNCNFGIAFSFPKRVERSF